MITSEDGTAVTRRRPGAASRLGSYISGTLWPAGETAGADRVLRQRPARGPAAVAAIPMERLSHSEWQLMRIVWRHGRTTVRDVLEEDLEQHQRDYRTILTFMSRMTKKGWLEVEKEGNINYYKPAIAQKKAVKEEIRRFLDEVVGREPENLELLRRELDGASRARSSRRRPGSR